MKVSATLKGRKDEYGRQLIYIRISDLQKREFRSTKMRIEPKFFKKGKVINHPSAAAFNEKIKNMVVQIEHQLLFAKEEVTVISPTFEKYTLDAHRVWDKQLKMSTVRQYMSERHKFSSFAPNTRMLEITPALLAKYQEHCYAIGNDPNSVWKTFKYIKKVLRKAHQEGVIKINPSSQITIKPYKQKRRDYMDQTELKKLSELAIEGDMKPSDLFILRWFLIGCFTGLRFSDWQQFNKKQHIKTDRIVLYTTKTGEVVTMPLVNETIALFTLLKWKPMHLTNQTLNRTLKEIMLRYGIHKKITAHISRHTFGVMCATNGISIEVCARLMGISLRVCQVYYKLSSEVTDKAYKNMFERLVVFE